MIHIEEKQTHKLPGKTSLFVNFTYNPMIVETVKQCTVANYDKKTTTWEVPLTSLSFLLDRLSQIDDVEIVLLGEEDKKQHEIYPLGNYKTKPYQYQIEGIEFGLNEARWLLLDAPGLGKTLQLIYLAQELKEKEGIEHCLIICGLNTLKNNWKDEIYKHSDMSCMILGERKTKNGKVRIGSVQERLDDLKKPIEEFFVVTNIQTIRDSNIVSAIKNGPNKFDMIILDEGHVCFPKGTLISTDLGQVPIEYLVEHKTKYKVLSYNESLGITEYKRINEKFKHDNESLLCLQFELDDGSIKTLNVTENHPIYTENRGYVPAYDITEDDILLFDDESLNHGEGIEYIQRCKLISKYRYESREPVYNISVEDNDNYFANGVLVHNCKSPTSIQGKNLLKLSAKYMILATGTILMNNPLDAYVPLKWIGADRSTYTNFKFYYCNYTGQFNNILLGYRNMDILKDQLEDVSLRRTKDLLDLPEKTIITEYVDMNDKQHTFYDNIKEGIIQQVDKVKMSTASLLAMVTRLRQATACPSILTTENIPSSKIERASDLAKQIIENGDKVVIFSTFKDSLYELEKEFSGIDYVVCHGDVSDSDINILKNRFQEDDNCKVMLATWQKVGTGITLTAASYAIFLDTPWNNAIFCQAQDRIHRIGSKKPVFIYNLVCKDTIDERVLELVESKGAISDYVVDDVISANTLESLKKYIEDLA